MSRPGAVEAGEPTIRIEPGVDPDPQLLGGKAASLARLAALGAPVPPAFVLTTEVYRRGFDEAVWERVKEEMSWLEEVSGRRFGSDLLVSVRSGSPVSMPGMMDTILNVGLTDAFEAPVDFVADCEEALRRSFTENCGSEVPADPYDQLRAAIEAVFRSWQSDRAQLYRRLKGIDDDLGTSATVQMMVFGNSSQRSGTGVLLTRDTTTGTKQPLGEFCHRAQGEELVSGERTPERLEAMEATVSDAFDQLLRWGERLEREAGDVQDIEFTVEDGELFLLQTRVAKRTAVAACEIVVALVEEGVIGREEALERTRHIDIDTVHVARVESGATPLASGRGAVMRVGHGTVAMSSEIAVRLRHEGIEPVLVTDTTSPRDLEGMRNAAAIVTRVGGMTSHAALVARELDIPCVVGCASLPRLDDGTAITVDGTAGDVYVGIQPWVESVPRAVPTLRSWREQGGC